MFFSWPTVPYLPSARFLASNRNPTPGRRSAARRLR